MSKITEIAKDLDKFRSYQEKFMIAVCVSTVCTVGCNLLGFKDVAVWLGITAALNALGVTFYSNKTNGITRQVLLETNWMLTGKGGFCYFVIIPSPRGEEAKLILRPETDYSIHNLSISIHRDPFVTWEEVEKKGTRQIAEETKGFEFTMKFEINEFKPELALDLGEIPYSQHRQARYIINFHARNGKQWSQKWTFIPQRQYGHNVVRDGEGGRGKILLEPVPYDKSMEEGLL